MRLGWLRVVASPDFYQEPSRFEDTEILLRRFFTRLNGQLFDLYSLFIANTTYKVHMPKTFAAS